MRKNTRCVFGPEVIVTMVVGYCTGVMERTTNIDLHERSHPHVRSLSARLYTTPIILCTLKCHPACK
jgi:hypothetical protein